MTGAPDLFEPVYLALRARGCFTKLDDGAYVELVHGLLALGFDVHALDALQDRANVAAKEDPRALLATWLQDGVWVTELHAVLRRAWCRLAGDQRALDVVAKDAGVAPHALHSLLRRHAKALGSAIAPVTETEVDAWCEIDLLRRPRLFSKVAREREAFFAQQRAESEKAKQARSVTAVPKEIDQALGGARNTDPKE